MRVGIQLSPSPLCGGAALRTDLIKPAFGRTIQPKRQNRNEAPIRKWKCSKANQAQRKVEALDLTKNLLRWSLD